MPTLSGPMETVFLKNLQLMLLIGTNWAISTKNSTLKGAQLMLLKGSQWAISIT
jgi:hypothetical protein